MTTLKIKKHDLLGLWLPGSVAAALLAAGLVGLIQRLTTGHELVAYGSYVPWGLWVAMYVYLVWLEVGSLLVFTALNYVFGWNKGLEKIKGLVYLTAFTALTPALLLIALDLGHPFRFWRTLVNPNFGSLMAWMVWLHLVYLGILIAKLALVVWGQRRGAPTAGLMKILAYVSLPVGVGLITTVGGIFGVLAARPLWQYNVLPLYFLISAIVSGSALITALYVWLAPDKSTPDYAQTAVRLGALTKGLLLFGAFAAASSALVTFYSNVPAQTGATRLALFGPYWWSFWVLHIGFGVLVPTVLLFVYPKAVRLIGVASALVVATFVAVPLNVIIPAQVATDTRNLAEAFTGFGLTLAYFPSLTEWLVTSFALGLGLAIFLAAFHLLPLGAHSSEG